MLGLALLLLTPLGELLSALGARLVPALGTRLVPLVGQPFLADVLEVAAELVLLAALPLELALLLVLTTGLPVALLPHPARHALTVLVGLTTPTGVALATLESLATGLVLSRLGPTRLPLRALML
ncbi:hypothetical protein G9C85_15450 [Halorubellus sp. JP-L1]|uniref:hypothetical protein n=1 Tax=Halorubellus sp. JP-L1 TaxID=2715753 RepID=UPI00140D466E|nr:hypothetical protein [Halorubellus sp. JP-L1]NHN43015.1 hypothetical protein [Halorubellus sp. JP-L1]